MSQPEEFLTPAEVDECRVCGLEMADGDEHGICLDDSGPFDTHAEKAGDR